MRLPRRVLRLLSISAFLLASACGGSGGSGSSGSPQVPGPGPATANPVLFVTQVPVAGGFGTVVETFGNHVPSMEAAPRGGGLMLRYPDGTLRNLTQEAGYGESGQQGAGAIAVREPCVHWSGTKAVFAMVVGAPTQQYQVATFHWQLYEVSGFGAGQTAVITKVANQPVYNNVSPCYGSDGRILFTSDRPHNGAAHLYPQRDEYESAPVVVGLYSLDPSTGDLFLLQHSPSGSFSPSVDSAGRVVFVRWDHMLRDQQSDADRQGSATFGTFDYADESAGAAALTTATEVFPHPRNGWISFVNNNPGYSGDLAGWAPNLRGIAFNLMQPWAIRQDGTDEETINHVGRQELAGYIDRSFDDDPNLVEFVGINPHTANDVRYTQGFFQLREDPSQPGTYLGVDGPEFGFHASGRVMRLSAAAGTNADAVTIADITHPDTAGETVTPNHSGRYRNPLALSDGSLIAAHSPYRGQDANDGTTAAPTSRYAFRLVHLVAQGDLFEAGAPLTGGLQAAVSWWTPDVAATWSGTLWELDPVEVVARPVPPYTAEGTLPSPEAQMLADAGVTVQTLKAFLEDNDLALIVSRDVTTRDRIDRQQPFNLQVTGTSHATLGAGGKVYDVSYLQIVQGDMIRGIGMNLGTPRPGRRVLARFLHDPAVDHPPPSDANAPAGSVEIADDGSIAALVPARRAVSWQLVDDAGTPVVQERYWVTFQPGEVRVCTSCHGLNQVDQAGAPAPTNAPKALLTLLEYLKTQGKL